MRRVTVQRPVRKQSARQRRRDAEESTAPRTEIRRDVQRLWFPEES